MSSAVPAAPDWEGERLAWSLRGAHRFATGRHRAPGLTGGAGRYGVIVVTLVVTSSLPILAAIGVSSASVEGGLSGGTALSAPAGTTPFIAPPSTGPVVVVPVAAGVAVPTTPPVPAASRPSLPPSAPPSAPARPVRPRLPREELILDVTPTPDPTASAPAGPLPRQIVVIVASPLAGLPCVPHPAR